MFFSNYKSAEVSITKIESPIVSWLICTHVINENLRLSIQSCLNQTFSDFELVVITNGPNAFNIAQEIRHWFNTDRRVHIFSTPIQHLTFSLSLGLHYARGEFIARMDADDLSKPDRIERQLSFMINNPQVIVLGTAYELIDDAGNILKKIYLPTKDKDIRSSLYRGNPICHPSVMFRRLPVLESGGYLGSIYAQDYDLWSRLSLNQKNKFANLDYICLQYRHSGLGKARKARLSYASMSSSQFRNYITGAGITWGLAAILTAFKGVFLSKK